MQRDGPSTRFLEACSREALRGFEVLRGREARGCVEAWGKPKRGLVVALGIVFSCGCLSWGCQGSGESNAEQTQANDGTEPEASNPSAVDPETHAPGERMKPTVLRSGDAEVASFLWWDAELESLCFVLPDGLCRPLGSNRVVYADPGCVEPIVMQVDGACYDSAPEWRRPKTAERPPQAECAPIEVNVLGSSRQAPTVVYTGSPGSCFTEEIPQAARFFELGSVASMVAFTSHVEPRAPGLDARVLEGPDGSRSVVDFYDPVHGWSCWTSRDFEPANVCWPRFRASLSSTFSDPTCALPAVSYQPSACRPTTEALVIADEPAQDCESRTAEVYELEGPMDAELYQLDAEGCVSAGNGVQSVLSPGSAVDPRTLPLIETLTSGTGRLKALYEGFGGVPYKPADPQVFFDSETQERCSPQWLENGTIACVPESFQRISFGGYSNSDCTGDSIYYRVGSSPCAPDLEGVLVEASDCELKYQPFWVTRFTGTTTYWLEADGSCTPQEVAQRPAYEFYVLGDAVDPSRFPTLEFEILE